MLKYNMFDAICHEHLTYYTSKVLVEMCKKNNLSWEIHSDIFIAKKETIKP